MKPLSKQQPTSRFTKTVQDYLKYRPSYPIEVLNILVDECGLTKDKVIADVGSGTGLLTKLFLDNGNKVYGIEPNQAMREAGEFYLKGYSNFISINGTAESTSLENHSVDFITAGTAFHWFNQEKTKLEFKRILKSPGWLLIVWNVRDVDESNLVRDYEALINQYNTDYCDSNAKKFEKTILENFFTPYEMHVKSFKNVQYFDWEGFKGRLASSSYSLREEDERYGGMIEGLKRIFDQYQYEGRVEFLYKTKVYYGRFK